MKKKKFSYYVSFAASSEGVSGIIKSSFEYLTDRKIKSKTQLKQLKKYIEEKNDLCDLVIDNFIFLRRLSK